MGKAPELVCATRRKQAMALEGGLYRDLTDSMEFWIRIWHTEGDSPTCVARTMQRPLWLVRAIIGREPWQERWRQERVKRGLEAAA